MSVKSIEEQQLFLLNKANEYLNKKKRQRINTIISSFCYLNSWSNVPGYSLLKWWHLGYRSIGKFLFINVRSFLSIAGLSYYQIFHNGNSVTYNKMVVSWCRKEDFDENNIYFDRYFKTRINKNKNTLWFLISIDNYIPANLSDHIFIFAKSRKGINIAFLLFSIRQIFKKNKYSIKKSLHLLSSSSVLAQMIGENVTQILKKNIITDIILPYEAQPLHHAIFHSAKSYNPEIQTKGYLHSALPPLMTDIYFRDGAPDILYSHGKGQIEILKKYLNWPSERLQFVPSLRFSREGVNSMNSFVFLPYDFNDSDIYVKEFEVLLSKTEKAGLPILKLRNHPHQVNSKKHINLMSKLEECMLRHHDKFDKFSSRNVAILIGATAAILEALERGTSVIHICTDPVFESHCEKIWNYLNVSQISSNTFEYSLKEQNQYIHLGTGQDMFEEQFVY